MANWTDILDVALAQDAALTSGTMIALRDNVVNVRDISNSAYGIASGAVGSPKIQFVAMDTWYVTGGGVGTYAFLTNLVTSSATYTIGSTLAGTNLRYAGVTGYNVTDALSGTWQCLGRCVSDNTNNISFGELSRVTLWQRIA